MVPPQRLRVSKSIFKVRLSSAVQAAAKVEFRGLNEVALSEATSLKISPTAAPRPSARWFMDLLIPFVSSRSVVDYLGLLIRL